MPFCLQCGHAANFAIPAGDSRPRLVCPACQFIHYENPKIICGTLCYHQDKILLCKRAIEPRYGYWTLPAGFMENGETMLAGAVRETFEEAQAIACNARLYCLFDIAHLGQVHAMYLAKLSDDGYFAAGAESLECALVDDDNINWDTLAFETIRQTIKHYLADKQALIRQGIDANDPSNYPLHQITLGDDTTPKADDR